MNRWKTRTAAVLLTAPLALTAACSDSGDVDVDQSGDPDEEAGSGG